MRALSRLPVRHPVALLLLGLSSMCGAQDVPNVTTHHYDNLRTGWNWAETALTTSNVNSTSFFLRKLAHNGTTGLAYLDQQIDAQPLVLNYPAETLSTDPVVYVATENNTVYAIDASTGAILTQRTLPEPAVPIRSVPSIAGCNNNSSMIGINSTPVIDKAHGIIYVVTATLGTGAINHYLHALDVNTLADRAGSPLELIGTYGSSYSRQRAALTLFNGGVLVPFASFCDANPTTTLGFLIYASISAGNYVWYQTTRGVSGSILSSIWMSGSGPATTGNSIYLATGNGSGPYPPGVFSGNQNLPESLVELTGSIGPPIGLSLNSWFTPPQYMMWDDNDTDFGSGGVLLVPSGAPSSIAANTPVEYVTAGGKSDDMYVNKPGALSDNSTPFQALAAIGGGSGCWCGTSYFTPSSGTGYVVTSFGSKLALYSVFVSGLSLHSSIDGPPSSYGDGGFFTSISSNGTSSGSQIIWAVSRPDANLQVWLYAYNGLTLGQLFSSPAGFWTNTGGNSNAVPVVADGQVYVASNAQLAIFGTSGPSLPPAPSTISADFNTDCPRALVSWSASPGATSYQLYFQSSAPPWIYPPSNPIYTGSAQQTDVRGVSYPHTYTFRVAACNASGCGLLSTAQAYGSPPQLCP